MNPSAMTAFEALNEPPTRTRRASAPARDYTPAEAVEPEAEFPSVPRVNIPVAPARFQPLIKKELGKLVPELAEIVRLAEREAQILAAAEQFTHIAARADYEAEAAALRADPTPGNLERLKNIGSMADRLDNYARQHRALDEDAASIRREAAPLIRQSSARIIKHLGEMADQAAREEAEVLEKWHIPAPYPSRSRDHYDRARQELAAFVRDQSEGRFHAAISSWLKRFI